MKKNKQNSTQNIFLPVIVNIKSKKMTIIMSFFKKEKFSKLVKEK